MNKILLTGLCALCLSVCLAQEVNELPMYGGLPKTPEQQKADQVFVDDIAKRYGTREEASKVALRLGFQHLARADRGTAMKRFNQAWLLTPDAADVFWGFGATLSYEGKFDESEMYFVKAANLNPANARMWADFGFMYQFWATKGAKSEIEKQAHLDNSIKLFRKASELEPTHDRIYSNWAASLYFKKDYKGAWEKVKEAERHGGKSIDKRFVRDLGRKMPRPAD